MAFARTRRLTVTSSTSAGTGAFVTSSFTPANSTRLVVRIGAISANNDAMAGGDLTISGGGLVWTSSAVSTTHPNWGYGDRAYTATVVTGASMTLSIDCGAFDVFVYRVEVDEFTEAGAIGATASGSDADGDGVGSLTLSGSPASSSIVLAYAQSISNGGTANTLTAGTGWSEIAQAGVNDWTSWQSQERTGSTSTGVGWDDLAATGNPGGATLIAVEIISAASGGGGVTVKSLAALGVG
jgi:hypothetical protein